MATNYIHLIALEPLVMEFKVFWSPCALLYMDGTVFPVLITQGFHLLGKAVADGVQRFVLDDLDDADFLHFVRALRRTSVIFHRMQAFVADKIDAVKTLKNFFI